MQMVHPNVALLKNLNLFDLDSCKSIIADDFEWHYFNSHLPELHGDYQGVDGLKQFFAKLGEESAGSFRVKLVDTWAAGDELVIVQVCNSMDFEGSAMEFDAIVVWRIVSGKLAEAWDIPAINSIRRSASS